VALGGLNYRIEHHLFPAMPSPHPRRAQPIVQAYCAEVGVAYAQSTLVASYGQALRHLHESVHHCAAAEAQRRKPNRRRLRCRP
jgi:fatty acid desaturase